MWLELTSRGVLGLVLVLVFVLVLKVRARCRSCTYVRQIGSDLGRFWDLGKLSVFREGVMFWMKSLDLSGLGLFAACETCLISIGETFLHKTYL